MYCSFGRFYFRGPYPNILDFEIEGAYHMSLLFQTIFQIIAACGALLIMFSRLLLLMLPPLPWIIFRVSIILSFRSFDRFL